MLRNLILSKTSGICSKIRTIQIINYMYLHCMMLTVAVVTFPFCRPIPYPAPSMYSLRLNCSVGSSISSATIGILVVAVVAPLVKVAVYRPAVKSAPAKNIISVFNENTNMKGVKEVHCSFMCNK